MRGTLTIYRRELTGLFLSPLAWILLLAALFLNGLYFVRYLVVARGEVGTAVNLALGGNWIFWGFLVFLPPLLTMRMLAEEARSGTLEFLLTAPVTEAAVVLGKFLAATTFMAILWLSVPLYGLAIQRAGVTPDWGSIAGGYCGAVLNSGLFVAIGLVASTLTSTPLLAAFLAFMADLWWLLLPTVVDFAIGELRNFLGPVLGGIETAEAWLRGGVAAMDVIAHTQRSFLPGVFDTAELVFFLTWTAFFLFLTTRLVEARRWRG